MAVIVTGLRIALPRLDNYQQEIQAWINQGSGLHFDIGSVKGYWRNTHPSLSLSDLQADLSGGVKHFSVSQVDVEFDLLQSLMTLRPQVSELVVDGIHVDISGIDLFHSSTTSEQDSEANNQSALQLQRLLLQQLSEFSLTNSSITFRDIAGEKREVDIERLNWLNNGNRHQAEGVISVKDVQLNSVSVIADFTDHNGLSNVSGDFYLQGKNFDIKPWVKPYLAKGVEVETGRVSLNTWITLDENKPVDAYLEISPSELKWREASGEENVLTLNSGVMKLEPQDNGFQVNAQDFSVTTNRQHWPDINFALQWSPQQWSVNANKLKLENLAPILDLLPKMQDTEAWVEKVNLGGTVEDLRVTMGKDVDSLQYSATLKQGRMNHWELIPGFNSLQAEIAGGIHKANAKISLLDDVLPYGDVFQAPLRIRQAQLDVVWESSDDGWSLWADKVSIATPDLQALGAFKLDFPKDKPAFLSFYSEADLLDAGQTWRYLPTLALGQGLTDYLSEGIRKGQVHTAKLLWYGELSDFPYKNHDGIFQAWVPLRKTSFSFSSAWPALTDMQLDLLFENETMFLDSKDAKLLNINAKRISGKIPSLSGDGHIEIFAAAKAKGSDVRDYMNASPLVDSVGAALTTIDIGGEVDSQFELYIPFADTSHSRAWGYADLNDNDINISSPPITLTNASGRIAFDNDKVSSSGLSASVLDQPISLDFTGQNSNKGYDTRIDLIGDWKVKPLEPYLGKTWLQRLSGHAPWNMGIDLQMNDVGFTYQIDTNANLKFLQSNYPAPLGKASGIAGKARLQASGNQESISARLQIPNAKFQTEINIEKGHPKLIATNTVIGTGSFRVSPIVGHNASLRLAKLDLDEWIKVLKTPQSGPKPILHDVNAPQIPLPKRVRVQTGDLKLGNLEWNDVNFTARQQSDKWQYTVDSSQVKGSAEYDGKNLTANLSQLQLYVSKPEKIVDDVAVTPSEKQPPITDFDRAFFNKMPNLNLKIDDFWMQGYKVGSVDIDMQHDGSKMVWNKANVTSGTSSLKAKGWWELDGNKSHSHVDVNGKGDDNSEIMARFGIDSGIQKAPFDITAAMNWTGSPWNMQVNTLKGDVNAEFGRGVISDVGGAAKLLGMFSLDSIIRRMQLDFSDVFDEGLAFSSINGTGKVEKGIFVTNNLEMDSISGDLSLKGLANLNTQMVDAEVTFSPDLTSGLPMLTAFAVAPQTALYVLAISTVVAPVVEVITKVTYEVKGPMNDPKVKEISRRKGDYEIPKEIQQEANANK